MQLGLNKHLQPHEIKSYKHKILRILQNISTSLQQVCSTIRIWRTVWSCWNFFYILLSNWLCNCVSLSYRPLCESVEYKLPLRSTFWPVKMTARLVCLKSGLFAFRLSSLKVTQGDTGRSFNNDFPLVIRSNYWVINYYCFRDKQRLWSKNANVRTPCI